jgi:hypothetical protein
LGIVSIAVSAQYPVVDPGDSIHSPRPLLDLARLMEQRFASSVTYEDPIWGFQGDLAPVGSGGLLFPAFRTFTVPSELTPAHRSKLDAATLGEALAAYHLQTEGPRYKISTSRIGLHLIPEQVRDAGGKLSHARNALDTVLNMPVAMRTPSMHLAALCNELSAATRAQIIFMGPGAYSLEHIYMPNGHNGRRGSKEDLTVAWGAQGISAREALINLLEPSATTLNWHFICRDGEDCFLQIGAIQFNVAMPDGQTGVTELLYDRCTNCPKLGPPPIPLVRK